MRGRRGRFYFGPLVLGFIVGGIAHRHFARGARRGHFSRAWRRHHPEWCDEASYDSEAHEPEGMHAHFARMWQRYHPEWCDEDPSPQADEFAGMRGHFARAWRRHHPWWYDEAPPSPQAHESEKPVEDAA